MSRDMDSPNDEGGSIAIGPTGDCGTQVIAQTQSMAEKHKSSAGPGGIDLPPSSGLWELKGTNDPTVTRPGPKHGTQKTIVFSVISIIAVTVFMPFLLSIFGVELSEKHWEYLHIIFPAEIGLLTTAMAFYFDLRD
ncbi:hypothetical protein [Burkholderia pseudomallei]|uniref:hypothetical protein n=1 Tax=Burkholderia pseudomallei TaxID=28450 RepID=UPI0011C4E97B|nr:hypothetical protein [Burkholderia pseudomallei]MBF3415620.1 hypothetical protein [Burkholderia pseudomallei]MBO7782583.1 hypothetical protein [Burkholderia pseudomallei]MBO7811621.1 hypothetical protein [Burkholderia pseudomallei]